MLITSAIIALGSFGLTNLPTICSIAGAVGVVSTAAEAAHAGYEDAQAEARLIPTVVITSTGIETKNIIETSSDRRKRKIKTYAKTFVKGAATIGCIMLSDRLHTFRYAKLLATAKWIQNNHNEYKQAAKEVFGEDEKKITDKQHETKAQNAYEYLRANGLEPVDTGTGNELFYEPISDTWFLASETHVVESEYNANRNFTLRGNEPFQEFLRFLFLEEAAKNRNFEKLGWDEYLGETFYGYTWIDFIHKKKTLSDGSDYIEIQYPFEPHLGEE